LRSTPFVRPPRAIHCGEKSRPSPSITRAPQLRCSSPPFLWPTTWSGAKPYLTAAESQVAAQFHLQLTALHHYLSRPRCLRHTREEDEILQAAGLKEFSELVKTSPEIEAWNLSVEKIAYYQDLFSNHSPDALPMIDDARNARSLQEWGRDHPSPPANATTNFISGRTCLIILREEITRTARSLAESLTHFTP
jgi:hypothetical protein